MKVLGIESSCDETAAAIYDEQQGLLAHQLYSQVTTHQAYGGVVPELASRDHIRKLLPLIQATLQRAQLKSCDIDGVAYTKGPGLIGALMVGASVARSLGYAWQVPTIGIHHMEAHLMAVMLEVEKPKYPFVALIVSGGHTMLVHARRFGNYQLLGETVDDAVGEAFDKTAKLLGLPYPGGPELAKLAEQGDPTRFQFPRPMLKNPNCDFSFSGLKTFARNCVENNPDDFATKAAIARAFEEAVVDTLVIKSRRALEITRLNQLIVVGGVGANLRLRERLAQVLAKRHGKVFFPRREFCTDNAAMVAYTGFLRLALGQQDSLSIDVKARWALATISR